mgnify:FL=1
MGEHAGDADRRLASSRRVLTVARIVQLLPTSPATFEGYASWSLPLTGGDAIFPGSVDRLARVARVDWVDVTVERLSTNASTDSVARVMTTLGPPWVGSPTPGFEGTWAQTVGSEAFAQLDDVQCQVGSAPTGGNGVSAPSAAQTLRFVPDDPAGSFVDGRSESTFVRVFAVDEPDFGVLPTSPPGRQVAAPSEWRLVSAFAQVLMKGGPYMGMRR